MDRLPTEAMQQDLGAGSGQVQRRRGRRTLKIVSSGAPWLIIAGLLWAGLFIKPQPVGSTVSPPVLERRDFFYGIAAPVPGVLWLAGSNGKIVRSDDNGVAWKRQTSASTFHLQDIAAWDGRTAVVVGNRGSVQTSSDGGATWTAAEAPKSAVANKLMRVIARPQGQAWTVGEMGALLQSTDFGRTWQRKRAEEDVGWNDISFADDLHGWVAGEFGRMLRTVDGGVTWLPVQAPVKSSLMGVAFRDASNGVAVGLEGVVLVTRDGGVTWTMVKSGTTEHLFAVVWDGSKNAWVGAGNQGVWIRGSEDGLTWTSGRLDQRDLSWHSEALVANGLVYFTGSSVGAWDGAAWRQLTSEAAVAADNRQQAAPTAPPAPARAR